MNFFPFLASLLAVSSPGATPVVRSPQQGDAIPSLREQDIRDVMAHCSKILRDYKEAGWDFLKIPFEDLVTPQGLQIGGPRFGSPNASQFAFPQNEPDVAFYTDMFVRYEQHGRPSSENCYIVAFRSGKVVRIPAGAARQAKGSRPGHYRTVLPGMIDYRKELPTPYEDPERGTCRLPVHPKAKRR